MHFGAPYNLWSRPDFYKWFFVCVLCNILKTHAAIVLFLMAWVQEIFFNEYIKGLVVEAVSVTSLQAFIMLH